MSSRRVTHALGAIGLTALVIGLSGCKLPDVSMSPGATTSSSSTSARPSPTTPAPTTVPAAATPARPSGELDSGSVTHSLPAGDRAVVIDYWTDQDPTTWTAATPKSLQLAAHLEGDPSAKVVVTRFVATIDDGTTRTTAAEDRGEFVITPPFSYSTALGLAPSTGTASSLTLYVQFELLVEIAPDDGAFFRQTVLDTLVLPLLEEDIQ